MNLNKRINAFVKLGEFLKQFATNPFEKNNNVLENELFFNGFKQQIQLAKTHNGWFTDDNLTYAFNHWSKLLNYDALNNWISNYNLQNSTPKTVAIIMAGNIPLVGFHDFLSVLLTGHKVLVKQSSNDNKLMPYLAKYLETIEPEFKDCIAFTSEKLSGFDAVIATGSNNTARYFEYYFKNKPSIIRKNRNSVAVLTGNETNEELTGLANDIFRYFGLGCRNVSKLFVPKGYNFDVFFNAIYPWNTIINYTKYANNYDYNKAVYLMSEFNMLENGFFMIKEDKSYSSPIATAFYEYYDTLEKLEEKLESDSALIQGIVGTKSIQNSIPFGTTQQPNLKTYADGVDTVDFLLKI